MFCFSSPQVAAFISLSLIIRERGGRWSNGQSGIHRESVHMAWVGYGGEGWEEVEVGDAGR